MATGFPSGLVVYESNVPDVIVLKRPRRGWLIEVVNANPSPVIWISNTVGWYLRLVEFVEALTPSRPNLY